MQPSSKTWSIVRRIAGKEATLFFASPVAYLFLASFIGITLFIVFWGEAFFARNIADVRPMFEWMPILLIILASTLTMRMWSEERRSGTLEHVLTQPVPLWSFVVGKFVGCLSLLALALAITLPLPFSVSLMGDLDWGPVFAGYLAAFLLGAAYLAIGLFVSGRSQNQIVSLLSSVGVCGLFYLVGTPVITNLMTNSGAEWMRQLGAGSRFESITRGVVDLSDLAYYLTIVAIFLALNTYVLERERWGTSDEALPRHRRWLSITGLVIANAVVCNLWLSQTQIFRWDMTEGQQYSISSATRAYLERLQEPLLIRGYFSSKTHPLLAPLVPKLKDLIREYAVAGGARVHVEFVDPTEDPEAEQEAAQEFGIKPMPFQVADRYQSSIVSSYFSVLIKYGTEYKVLGFQDLIEVRASNPQDIQVQLHNPEYDLTRTIKKVVDNYQGEGDIYSRIDGKVELTAYLSPDHTLPSQLKDFRKIVQASAEKAVKESDGHLVFQTVDPTADGGKVAQQLHQDYGLTAMASNLLSQDRFYFYLILERGDQLVQIPLEDFSEATFERNLKSGLKRYASGFNKTVALVTPAPEAPANPYEGPSSGDFQELEAFLQNELTVVKEDLSDGSVSSDADLLLLAAPKDLDEKAQFAIDQFLMQGGTVVALTSPYSAGVSPQGLKLSGYTSGLKDWLAHQGIAFEDKLLLDTQCAALPIPMMRDLGGMQVQEIRMVDYPYFLDVRGDGLDQSNPITSDLPQVNLPWASPLVIDKAKIGQREVIELLHSSAESWLSDSLDVSPRIDPYGGVGYTPSGPQNRRLVGAVVSGEFESAFKGRPSPLLNDNSAPGGSEQAAAVIEHSPSSARLIVLSSNDLVKDPILRLQSGANGGPYLNSLQLLANAIDWSLEDSSLLTIRSRGHFNRTLPPMEQRTQMIWEATNYILALFALLLVAGLRKLRERRRLAHFREMLAG